MHVCPSVHRCVLGGFTRPNQIQVYDVSDAQAEKCAGIFYGGTGASLAANSVFALLILVWVGCFSTTVFGLLGRFFLLRVTDAVEEVWPHVVNLLKF